MWVCKFFFLFIIDGITEISPIIEEKNKIKGTDCQPKKNPSAAINLASPKPIASTFFNLSYKKIINQMPDITYTTLLNKEFENIGGSIIKKNIVPKVEITNEEGNIQKDSFDIKELTLINILLEYPSLLDDDAYAKYITNSVLTDIYESALREREKNQNFKAAHIINQYTDDHIIHEIMTMESNEKSEDSARLTINEITSQLEKNSNEKIYFDLLNRYSNGDKLSDDERQFIKNFKK